VDNRRLLIAVVLSLAVLLGWQLLVPKPPPPPLPTPSGVEEPAATPAEPARPTAEEPSGGTEQPVAEAAPEPAAPEPAETGEPIAADAERRVVVETERFRAELTNRGAQLVSFVLHEHTRPDGGPLDLVRGREGAPYPFALVGPELAPLALDEALFAVDDSAERGARTVTFRYRGPAGAAEKSFVFRPDGLFDVTVRVDRPRDPRGWSLWLGPGIRNPTKAELSNRFENRGGVFRLAGKYQRISPKKAEEPTAVPGGGLQWAGLDDHYFLTVAIPTAPVKGVRFQPFLMVPDGKEGEWRFAPVPPKEAMTAEQKELERDFALVIDPAGTEVALTDYWGAKKIRRLASLPLSLGDTVDLGWFGFFARFLFDGLVWIHEHLVANYGWAIVLLTVVINLVLLPLTHKSYTSMQKMQELNPKMQAIRDRYRGKLKDTQGKPKAEAQRKMNEEIMALYKAEGVNPAGGCLPMLIQLPVLFAFYRLLGAAVELRGAPWILWIHDLSAPDPYYALPLIMGATQFLQQRMTPMGGDPMQRRIFQLMPIFMTFLFLGFPTGMVLYWLTNNVLTIARQAIYLRFKNRKAAGEAALAKAKKGKRKS
jgi:YidC/Oxa1 family membrane protein insertase